MYNCNCVESVASDDVFLRHGTRSTPPRARAERNRRTSRFRVDFVRDCRHGNRVHGELTPAPLELPHQGHLFHEMACAGVHIGDPEHIPDVHHDVPAPAVFEQDIAHCAFP